MHLPYFIDKTFIFFLFFNNNIIMATTKDYYTSNDFINKESKNKKKKQRHSSFYRAQENPENYQVEVNGKIVQLISDKGNYVKKNGYLGKKLIKKLHAPAVKAVKASLKIEKKDDKCGVLTETEKLYKNHAKHDGRETAEEYLDKVKDDVEYVYSTIRKTIDAVIPTFKDIPQGVISKIKKYIPEKSEFSTVATAMLLATVLGGGKIPLTAIGGASIPSGAYAYYKNKMKLFEKKEKETAVEEKEETAVEEKEETPALRGGVKQEEIKQEESKQEESKQEIKQEESKQEEPKVVGDGLVSGRTMDKSINFDKAIHKQATKRILKNGNYLRIMMQYIKEHGAPEGSVEEIIEDSEDIIEQYSNELRIGRLRFGKSNFNKVKQENIELNVLVAAATNDILVSAATNEQQSTKTDVTKSHQMNSVGVLLDASSLGLDISNLQQLLKGEITREPVPPPPPPSQSSVHKSSEKKGRIHEDENPFFNKPEREASSKYNARGFGEVSNKHRSILRAKRNNKKMQTNNKL